MGMFDIFKDNLSNPAVTIGSTLLKSAQEGKAILADKKRKEEEAAIELQLFKDKEDIKQQKILERQELEREAQRQFDSLNYATKAKEDGIAAAIKSAEEHKAKNVKNKTVGWSKTLVSQIDIDNYNEQIKNIAPKAMRFGIIDSQDELVNQLYSGALNLSTVFADVQEAEEALEKEKKAYPTYEQLQTKKETDEKIKQTQAQFAGSSIEEAKNIIGFLEKGKIIVDFPANFLEDTNGLDAVRDYNLKNVQQITPDSTYLVLPSLEGEEYAKSKGRQRNILTEAYIKRFSTINDKLFKAMEKHSPQNAYGIQRDLGILVQELWALKGGMQFTEDGQAKVSADFELNWEGLLGDITKLPKWYQKTLKEAVAIHLPEQLKEVVTPVLEQTINTQTQEVETVLKFTPYAVDKETVENVFPSVVYQERPVTVDEYKLHAFVAHSNAYGIPLSDYGIRKDSENNRIVLGDIESQEQKDLRVSALGEITDADKTSLYGAKLYSPLFYNLQNGGSVRKLKRKPEDYDQSNFEYLQLAKLNSRLEPQLGMPIDFDPRLLTENFIRTSAAGIRIDSYGNFLLPDISGIGQAVTRRGSPRSLLKYRSITNGAQYAEFRELNTKDLRDQAGQSEKALQAAYDLYELLNITRTGAGIVENTVLLFDGLSSIFDGFGSGLRSVFTKGGYTREVDSQIRKNIQNIPNMDEDLRERLLDSLDSGFNKTDLDGSDPGLFNFSFFEKEQSAPELIARQQMLHASLVFYAAAAFQGEGGKAISDADRDFVAWALNYGMFSSAKARKASILGLIGIMSKSHAINSALASGNVPEMWAADNYNRVAGKFLDRANRGLALAPKDYPKWIRDKYKLDSRAEQTNLNSKIGITMDNDASQSYQNIPEPGTIRKTETATGDSYKIGSTNVLFDTNQSSKNYEKDRNNVINLIQQSKTNKIIQINEDEVERLIKDFNISPEEIQPREAQ